MYLTSEGIYLRYLMSDNVPYEFMTRTTHVFFPEKLYWCVLMTHSLYKKPVVSRKRVLVYFGPIYTDSVPSSSSPSTYSDTVHTIVQTSCCILYPVILCPHTHRGHYQTSDIGDRYPQMSDTFSCRMRKNISLEFTY